VDLELLGMILMSVARFCVFATVLLSSEIHAQSFSFGVKGGVPLTAVVEGNGPPAAKRYIVGPMIEVGLPFSFAFEANALYRRTGYEAIAGDFGASVSTRLRTNSWEFPLLAKYYFRPRIVPAKFFATGGYVIRYMSGFDISIHSYGTDPQTGEPD
jgi:hypothetical protein